MNTTTPPGLPEFTDARRDALEADLFRKIAADARPRRRAGVRRWLAPLSAAAAVLVVAAVLGGVLRDGPDTGASSADAPAIEQHSGGAELEGQPDSGAMGATGESAPGSDAAAGDVAEGREVVATASAWLEVDDAADAVDALSRAVTEGGYVESSGVAAAADAQDAGDGTIARGADAWITMRVPADQLEPLLAELPSFGRVLSSEVDRADVTREATDLRARVAALDASVARLTELIGQAASTADLLAAEAALSERQAERDALQAQLTALEGRVALSSLTVTISEPQARTQADPEGFGDGLATGWASLIAVGNAIVIGLGFLLPWLVPAAVVTLIVVAIRRRRRAAARG